MERNASFRRHQRKRIIKRKRNLIVRNRQVDEGFLDKRRLGMLDKGKVHCSCWMCKGHKFEYHTLMEEKKKAMQEEINEYYKQED